MDGRSINCTLIAEMANCKVSAAQLNQIFASLTHPCILGGNPSSRFSYWAAEPKETFSFCAGSANPFEKLNAVLARYKLVSSNKTLPAQMFNCGWMGYFAYELGRYVESIPCNALDDLQMPIIHLSFYDRVIAYDSQTDCYWLLALEIPGDSQSAHEKITVLKTLLSSAQAVSPKTAGSKLPEVDIEQFPSNMTKREYLDAVSKIKKYIYDGDVYQVNLSYRLQLPYSASPVDLFNWQSEHNPCPYAAYIDAGSFSIVSTSPELFLAIESRDIQTTPIKGTRPRVVPSGADAKTVNEHQYNELANSEKEQAELNMIVDLERNDFARVCVPGSIKWLPRVIEEFPTVFHASRTVQGRLRDEITFCDCLKAAFPGGSITGAPKISAMKIIDQLEATHRCVYTGAIGYIGIDGNVCLNVAIRTIIIKNKQAFLQVGGGIVADSSPGQEWDETITKARALVAGIAAVQYKGTR